LTTEARTSNAVEYLICSIANLVNIVQRHRANQLFLDAVVVVDIRDDYAQQIVGLTTHPVDLDHFRDILSRACKSAPKLPCADFVRAVTNTILPTTAPGSDARSLSLGLPHFQILLDKLGHVRGVCTTSRVSPSRARWCSAPISSGGGGIKVPVKGLRIPRKPNSRSALSRGLRLRNLLTPLDIQEGRDL
jgi:hypothetical protein